MGETNERSKSRAEEQLFQYGDGVQVSACRGGGEEQQEWPCLLLTRLALQLCL